MTTTHRPAPLVFIDTETTGLHPYQDDIWEIAAVRRDVDGTESEFHAFVEHSTARAKKLPDSFRLDYVARYQPEVALPQDVMVRQLAAFIGEAEDYAHRPHIIGAVPSFDTERLDLLFDAFSVPVPWHHHLIDAETLAVGCLRGRRQILIDGGAIPAGSPAFPPPPWDSDDLSRAIGVDPDQFPRHTALGDVRWAMAIYDRVMGGAA